MDSGVLEMYCVNWSEHVGMQTFCFGAVKKLPFIYGHFFRTFCSVHRGAVYWRHGARWIRFRPLRTSVPRPYIESLYIDRTVSSVRPGCERRYSFHSINADDGAMFSEYFSDTMRALRLNGDYAALCIIHSCLARLPYKLTPSATAVKLWSRCRRNRLNVSQLRSGNISV